jgi:hypothetical protein
MKKKLFIGLVGLVSILSINGLLAGADWKETEISKNIRMNYKPNIIPPGPDVPTEIAAFSGRWEGKASSYQSEWILVVEEITPPKAKVIWGWRAAGRTRAENDSQRFQAEIVPGSKPQLKIFSGDTKLTLEPGDSPRTLKGVREHKGRITLEMVLDKVE